MIGSLLLLTSCTVDTKRMENYGVQGIDVSHYQSSVDWPVVAAQGFDFAFVKATEGATLNDSLFCRNWPEMKKAGLIRGAYHFFRPKTPVAEQVDNFSSWVELEHGDLPPVLDVEVLDGVDKIQLITGIRTWLFMVELKYNIRPIIYTNLKFYNRHLAGQFDDYPLWIARYHWREPVLACGRTWDFWQYGNRGRMDGVRGFVDFNVFNGDRSALEALCLAPARVLSRR